MPGWQNERRKEKQNGRVRHISLRLMDLANGCSPMYCGLIHTNTNSKTEKIKDLQLVCAINTQKPGLSKLIKF